MSYRRAAVEAVSLPGISWCPELESDAGEKEQASDSAGVRIGATGSGAREERIGPEDRSGAISELQADVLGLGEEADRFVAASRPTPLWRIRRTGPEIAKEPAVDPDRAALDRSATRMRAG